MIFEGIWLLEGTQDWFEGLWNQVLAVPQQIWKTITALTPSLIRDIYWQMNRVFYQVGWGAWSLLSEWTADIPYPWNYVARVFLLPAAVMKISMIEIIGGLRLYGPSWFVNALDWLLAFKDMATYSFWSFVEDPLNALKPLIHNVYQHVPPWIQDILNMLWNFQYYVTYSFWTFVKDPAAVFSGVVSGIRSKVDDVKDWMDNFHFPEVVIPSITWPNWNATIVAPIANAFTTAMENISVSLAKPLQDFWTWLWTGFQTIVGVVVGGIQRVGETLRPVFEPLGQMMMQGLSEALTPGSPPKEIELMATSYANNLFAKINDTLTAHMKSPITPEEAVGAGAGILGALTAVSVVGNTMGMMFDATHPAKKWGTQDMFRHIEYTMMTGAVTSPILTVPVAIAAIEPMRYFYNNMFRSVQFDADTLNRALWRGLITEAEWAKGYGYLGFSDERINVQRQLRVKLPGIGDVIKYAVREAFYDDYSLEYGLDDEYPPQLTHFGKMIGYMEETLKYDWRSHWALPSLTMGYEMLHRNIILPPDLDNLFKAHDIIPWWRGRLKALSFKVYTRVDVRRMYAMGILDRAAVKRSYLDVGYNAERAEGMTRFTVAYYEQGDREITKSDILKGYRTGQLLYDDAVELLVDMDFTEDHASYLLSLEDHRSKEEGRELSRSQLEKTFIQGLIPSTTFLSKLEDAGWTKEASDLIYQMSLIKKQEAEATDQIKAERDVSRSVLNKAYILQIISEMEYRDRMRSLRYSEEAINLFLAIDEVKLLEDPKRLPLGTLREALRKDVIEVPLFRERTKLIGYADDDVDIILGLERKLLPVAYYRKAFKAETIDEAEFRAKADELGFIPREIDLMIKTERPPTPPTEEEIRRLSKGDVVKLFKQELLTPAQAQFRLMELGYLEEDAKLLLEAATPAA